MDFFGVKIFNIDFDGLEYLRTVFVKFFLHLGHLLPHRAVPVVLDAVVVATSDYFSNLGPLAVKFSVEQEKDPFLDLCPLALFIYWVKMLMPSFPANFTISVRYLLGYVGPLLPNFFNKQHQGRVLVVGPRPLRVIHAHIL